MPNTYPDVRALGQTVQDWLSVRLGAYIKMNNTRVYKENRFKFLGASVALIMGLVIVLPKTQDAQATPETTIEPTALAPAKPLFDLTRQDLYLEEGTGATTSFKRLVLKSGDSLGPLLQKNNISPEEAYAVTKTFAGVYDPRYLKVGQSFNLYFDKGDLSHLTFKPSVEQTIFISKRPDGTFAARNVEAEFKMDLVAVQGEIKNSLYLDAYDYDVPDRVIGQFANIYEYSVDFQRDIQPGDKFEMLFEVARDKQGKIVKSGDLVYTSFAPHGKPMDYYLFTDSKGKENYYDADGKTSKRKLRATPIDGARISSRFGKRRHPIKGYMKMHKGVDFAARTGTPIMAAGAGVIEHAGVYGGYGNFIRIRHTDGYKTAYAHMSKFARGMRRGTRVRQDQIIGYVGSTGMSTGPHLHYEVLLNNRHINPRRLAQLSGKPLPNSERASFKSRIAQIEADMKTAEKLRSKSAAPALRVEAPASTQVSAGVTVPLAQ